MENWVERRPGDLPWFAVELVADAEKESGEALDERVNARGLNDRLNELLGAG